MEQKIGIIGLGLIGASLAKAFKDNAGCLVAGYDINPETITKAITEGVMGAELRNLLKEGRMIKEQVDGR